MSKSTVSTSVDAVVRVAEDVAVVVGTAVATWTATHSVNDVLAAVGAAPLVRSALAASLSGGRVSGLLAALKIVRAALATVDTGVATVQADLPLVAKKLPSLTDAEIQAAFAALPGVDAPPVVAEAKNPNATA